MALNGFQGFALDGSGQSLAKLDAGRSTRQGTPATEAATAIHPFTTTHSFMTRPPAHRVFPHPIFTMGANVFECFRSLASFFTPAPPDGAR